MADLYSARLAGANGFEKLMAIKRLRPDLQHDSQFINMFLDEARIAALMDHPNIVQVYDLDTDGDTYYMLMEYLRGHDLGALASLLLARGQWISLAEALRIVIDVARALHYAHEMRDGAGRPLGIVHRDVSPRNVFITDRGLVKLIDFGVLKADDRLAFTDAGVIKGKYPYMAPEQVELREVDRRADVFSLGVLLWELTTGRRLFFGVTDYQIAKRVINDPIPRPSSSVPSYPAALELVVMKSLERDRTARYQTLAEMLHDLQQVVRREAIDLAAVDLAALVDRHNEAMGALVLPYAAPPEIAIPAQVDTGLPTQTHRVGRLRRRGARMSAALVAMVAAAAAFGVTSVLVAVPALADAIGSPITALGAP